MSRPRPRKAGGWMAQVANDPEWDSSQPSHIPLYAGSMRKSESESALLGDERVKTKKHETFSQHFQDLRGDYCNMALLVFLYVLQGVPLGLTGSIPLVLSNRHVSYAQQAVFSFAYWPFSLKLLWAPIVDSCFWVKIGRRKSWLVPTQYLIGVFMLILSCYVTSVLGDDKSTAGPNVVCLTTIFFMFNFLAATQDIAVDGWALTMLSKRNVGYASTCNAVGQTAGYFLGNVVFLALESPEFCNKYLRTTPQPVGVVTLAGDFVYIWAWIFIVTTTLVLILKKEGDSANNVDATNGGNEDLGLIDTYKILKDIIRLKPVFTLILIHMTAKIAMAAADGITGLKLVEFGVPKDKLAFIAVPLVPLQILLPILIGKFTAGPKPLNVYLKAYPYRILMNIIFALLVYWTPWWKQSDGQFPLTYYVIIVIAYCFHQITVYSTFVAVMAFHAQISDPQIGGTYMTLMNTVSNLGANWPVTLSLSIVDRVTWKNCISNESGSLIGPCMDELSCKTAGGSCAVTYDGYYILSAFCAVFGFLWYRLMRRRIERLQDVDKYSWSLKRYNTAKD